MPCYFPIHAHFSKGVNEAGKRLVVFKRKKGYPGEPVQIPCGQCIGCRLERSRQWAIRCVHEASLYENNCFITLTFNEDYLPQDGSLCKADFQKFIKRLRKKFGAGVRYFHCGEYGGEHNRPHHHACLFNFDFTDKDFWKLKNGVRLYRSAALENLWKFGFCTVGDVTFESAAYVARYVMKKVIGEDAYRHYEGREPEYTTMSRRPGIGKEWFDKFRKDVYPRDSVVIRGGIECKPPKFYDRELEKINPVAFDYVKEERKRKAQEDPDNTWQRLRVRESIKKTKVKLLTREIEI